MAGDRRWQLSEQLLACYIVQFLFQLLLMWLGHTGLVRLGA